jgi:hypothetical protein
MIRLRWFADYSALTRRYGYVNRMYAHYNSEKSRKRTGRIKGKPTRQDSTFLPKYVRYINRNSNLTQYPYSDYIKTYKRPIYIFAIQDMFSRFIVHACLKEQPYSGFANFPYWFSIEDCLKQTFREYGKPLEMIVDRYIEKNYSELLRKNCALVTGCDHPSKMGSLERFFQSVQYEMRTELTEENFKAYVDFYNFKRPHSALNGYTPSQAWLAGSETLFENYQKNTRSEDRAKLLSETRKLVEINCD